MIGGIPAFSNTFSTIIASNAAGINWKDGLPARLVLWVIVTGLMVWYILRYAAKVKKDPSASLVLKFDGTVKPPYETKYRHTCNSTCAGAKNKIIIADLLTHVSNYDRRCCVFKMVDNGNVCVVSRFFHTYCHHNPDE